MLYRRVLWKLESDGPIKRLGPMGRGHRPLAGERVGADASDGHQHAYCVDEGARLAEEVAGEEDHDEPPDSVEHGDTEAYSTGWHAEYEEAYGFTDDSGNPIQGRAASKDPNDDEDDGARTLDF